MIAVHVGNTIAFSILIYEPDAPLFFFRTDYCKKKSKWFGLLTDVNEPNKWLKLQNNLMISKHFRHYTL